MLVVADYEMVQTQKNLETLKQLVKGKVDVRMVCCQVKNKTTKNYHSNHAKWIRADNFVVCGSANWTKWCTQNNEVGTVVKLTSKEARDYWENMFNGILQHEWTQDLSKVIQGCGQTYYIADKEKHLDDLAGVFK